MERTPIVSDHRAPWRTARWAPWSRRSWRLASLALAFFLIVPGALLGVSQAVAPLLVTFEYTGAIQMFTDPDGATSVTITATGVSGGESGFGFSQPVLGGHGAVIQGDFLVTPLQELSIQVGGAGEGSV